MKKYALLLALALMTACSANEPIEAPEQINEETEKEYVENKTENTESEEESKTISMKKDKEDLEEIKTNEDKNPKPNEKPPKDEGEDDLEPQDVEVVRVYPDNDSSESGQGSNTTEGFFKPKFEINDSSYSSPLIDAYVLSPDEELYLVEEKLGVNITVIDQDDDGQSILLIPRYYHGMLKINTLSYNDDQEGYKVKDELINVYMAEEDAILLRADLDEDDTGYLVSYYDNNGAYEVQSLLTYSSDSKSLILSNGFMFNRY